VNKVYTIGYEGKTIEEFLDLLKEKEIQHLVDVRSSPRSRKIKFNKDNLKDRLFHNSIVYRHIPDIGGLREEDYEEVMTEEKWIEGYEELKDLAREGKTVIMCLEKDPMMCHRRYIAERLEEDGWEVVHIGRGGSWKEKSLDDF